jgi:toxin ParE1/3/4
LTAKPVVPRRRASRDVDEIVDYYVAESSQETALRFIDALESAYGQIAAHPGIGSLRYAYELALPELRFWPLKGFPYLVFYVEHDDHIDVWRVLHSCRDIPRWLREERKSPDDASEDDCR